MSKLIFNAQVEMTLPGHIVPIEFNQSLYNRSTILDMRLQLEIKDAVIVLPDGRRMVFPKLVIQGIRALGLPVVEGDKVVMFRYEDADEPIMVGAAP